MRANNMVFEYGGSTFQLRFQRHEVDPPARAVIKPFKPKYWQQPEPKKTRTVTTALLVDRERGLVAAGHAVQHFKDQPNHEAGRSAALARLCTTLAKSNHGLAIVVQDVYVHRKGEQYGEET